MPLLVLSADHRGEAANSPMGRAGSEMQASLAHLLPNGMQVQAAGSGHFIQLDRPELVIEAIRNVVSAARLSMPQLLAGMLEPAAPLRDSPASLEAGPQRG
jgi:hypothetical protein